MKTTWCWNYLFHINNRSKIINHIAALWPRSPPHTALLITPLIIHHLSHHIQKYCPCHEGYTQFLISIKTWKVVRKTEARVEWMFCSFLPLHKQLCLWFNTSDAYESREPSGIIFFIYTTYCMGSNQHLAGLKFGVCLAVVTVNCRRAITIDSMQV